MGCGSTTETKVKTGDLSARGKSYESLFSGMLMSNLSENGYDVTPSEKTTWNDPDQANMFQGKIGDLQAKMAKIDEDIATKPITGAQDSRVIEKQNLQRQIDNNQSKLDKIGKVTYTDYKIEKKPDPRVQQAIEKFGENSPEATTMMAQVKQEEVDKASSMASVEKSYLKNLQKFVSGDMSYTDEQKKQVETYVAPIKDVIMSTTDTLLKQVGDDDQALRGEMNKISLEIDKTGFAVDDALKAASIQIDKTGATLMDTLKGVNDSNRARYKFEQDLMFQQIDQHNAQQAAMLGLPPGSNLEKFQNAKMKNDALKSLDLDLAQSEAQGALNIQSYVGGEREKISMSKVALAEAQGQKKEGLAGMGLNIAERTAGKTEDILGARGNALLALEQNKQGQLQNLAYGGIPSLLSAATGGMAFDANMKAQNQQLQAGAMAPVTQQLGVEQQRQFAETDTTQKTNKGFLDTFSDILGMGAGVASTAMTGLNVGGYGNRPTAQPAVAGYQPTPFTLF